jgi:hypothetical protein
VIAYVAGGWIALTGVDQLVDRQVLPELIYRISLVLFIGGLGIALILGWYHGEKGAAEGHPARGHPPGDREPGDLRVELRGGQPVRG